MHFKALFSSGFAARKRLEQLYGVRKWIPAVHNENISHEEQEADSAEDVDITVLAAGSSSSGKERARVQVDSHAGLEKQVN